MQPRSPPDLDLRLPARPESVTAARHAVRRLAEQLGLPQATVHDLMLAVTEACANVVLHAYEPSEAGVFEVTAKAGDGVLCVTVRDWGRGMLPRSRSAGLGLGIPLMSQLTAALEIRAREGRGAEVQMTLPFASGNGGAREMAPSAA